MSGMKIWELPEVLSINDEAFIAVDNGQVTRKISVGNYNNSANTTAKAFAEAAALSATNAATSVTQAAQKLDDINVVASNVTNTANTVSGMADTVAANVATANAAAVNAANSASNASVFAQDAKDSAEDVEDAALLAESWARGGTGIRAGEDTNNAAYYARQAGAAVSGGVTSFNARGGAVFPEPGDYNAQMITRGTSNVNADLAAVESGVSAAQSAASVAQSAASTADAKATTAQATATTADTKATTALSNIANILGDFADVEAAATASKAYEVGDYLVLNEQFYKVTAAIAQGNALTVGGNIEPTNVGAEVASLNKDLDTHRQVIPLNNQYGGYLEINRSGKFVTVNSASAGAYCEAYGSAQLGAVIPEGLRPGMLSVGVITPNGGIRLAAFAVNSQTGTLEVYNPYNEAIIFHYGTVSYILP